jgi:hypothetical protein
MDGYVFENSEEKAYASVDKIPVGIDLYSCLGYFKHKVSVLRARSIVLLRLLIFGKLNQKSVMNAVTMGLQR